MTEINEEIFSKEKIIENLENEFQNIDFYKEKAIPLTLIAFKGGDPISDLIRFIERIQTGKGEFSHVGLLINSQICPFIPGLEQDKIYVWESTMSSKIFGLGGDGVADASTKKTKFGVQIRDLEELLPKYLEVKGTGVAYCNLINNPWERKAFENMYDTFVRREKIIKTMEKVYRKYHEKLYELNCVQLCSTVFPCLRRFQYNFGEKIVEGMKYIGNTRDLKGDDDDFVFCSEFVAIVYKSLGIIDCEFKPHEVSPMDFFGGDVDGIPKLVEDPVYFKN